MNEIGLCAGKSKKATGIEMYTAAVVGLLLYKVCAQCIIYAKHIL